MQDLGDIVHRSVNDIYKFIKTRSRAHNFNAKRKEKEKKFKKLQNAHIV